MSTTYHHSFKSWVPRWLMVLTILLTLVPITAVLGIYIGGMDSAMSYYAADSYDIKFSIIMFYVGIASAFSLEKTISTKFATKPYFTMSCILFILVNLILYNTQNLTILIVFRFLNGMLTLVFVGTLFNLIFQQFHSQRSRVLSYAFLYGTMFGSIPLSYIVDAVLFSNYNFNILFILIIFSCLPGFVLLFVCLKKEVELRKEKTRIKDKVDWVSFVLYAAALTTVTYILCYGQYYNWFKSLHIILTTITFVISLLLFVFRQLKLETPYVDLSIYKYRNFRIGMLMLVAFYITKGDTSVSFGFFANGLNLDVYHKSYVMIINGIGVIFGALLTARFILAGVRIRLIWLTGFASFLFFHIYMIFILGNQAEILDIILPLFFQGFGNGILIVSIVIFYATGVPSEIGFYASVTGVSYRCFTFTLSMALVTFMGLRQGSMHYNNFAEDIVITNPATVLRLQNYNETLLSHGASKLQASAGARKMLGKAVGVQSNLLFARDYYMYLSCFIIFVMLGIALIPHFHYQLRKISDKLTPI
ncbi:MFS transporter [Formosa sp. L2A11]|uniref:MFS transporter n=1 Tax=Formosa sp. L2A11 TaxID=2686363 RepID=UPI00131BBF7C|nr:MFS transporter [Formosa sp. L2A11]